MRILAAAVLALAAQGAIPLSVDLGKTVERDVGNATGWFCDDPSLVTAELVTRGEVNVWRVTGAKPGSTQCRVGTDPTRASFVFDVTVNARSAGKKR